MDNKFFLNFANKKFTQDVFINGISTFIIALSGIIINTLIGKYYGARALGAYNSVLALYVIFSIITVFGIPNSILKYCSENKKNQSDYSKTFCSGLILIFCFSCILTTGCYFLINSRIIPLHADKLIYLNTLLWAIPFFSLNKGFRGYYNSQRKMKTYALIESSRWLSISLFTITAVYTNAPLHFIFKAFLITEVLLTCVLFIYTHQFVHYTFRLDRQTFKQHLSFGSKTILGGGLLIINNKVDILMISFFTSDFYVGIYSLAAEIAKGLLLLCQIVQTNFNPIISELVSSKNFEKLKDYTKRIKKIMFYVMLPVVLTVALAYPFYIQIILQNAHYNASISLFYILLFGVGCGSMYFWAGGMLSMAGFPEVSMKRNMILLTSNILLNLILIPLWGITGAAIATSFTYFIRILTLKYYIKKKLGMHLI